MGTFVVYSDLTYKEAKHCIKGIPKWFDENPDRDTCNAEFFTVRRGHVVEDVLKVTDPKAKAKIKAELKKKKSAKKVVKKTAKKVVKKTAKKAAKKAIKASKKKISKKAK